MRLFSPTRALLCALVLALCSSPSLLAQSAVLPLFAPDAGLFPVRPANVLHPVPGTVSFLRLNSAWFDTVSVASVRLATLREFPFPDGTRHTLHLNRFSVLSPTGVLFEGGRGGDRAVVPDKQLFFRGTVEGVEGSFVYLAVFPGFVSGFIEVPRAGSDLPQRIMIAPDNLDNPVPTMIVFDETDAPTPGTPPLCGVEDPFAQFNLHTAELESVRREAAEREAKGYSRSLQSEPHLVAQIAIECDDDFFRVHSSNLARAANYALAIMGAASSVYQRDIGIELQVPFLRVWTTNENPYPGPKDGDLLDQLRDNWEKNMQSVQHTSTVLMTSYRGGLAWVGAMCGNYGYAMTGPGGNFNFPANSYVWDIDVTSHELGHNFGSPHTHSCFWAPAVDSCYDAEGGCFPATNPHPGTIMSYCHLNAGTVLKFHPRVSTYIRTAAERYPCVTPPPTPATHDAAVVAILTPATGGLMVQGGTFVPSALVRNLGLSPQNGLSLTCRITSITNAEVYTSTKTLSALDAGGTAQVTFSNATIADTGVYQIAVTVTATADEVPVNNTVNRPFQVVGATPGGTLRLVSPNGGEVYAADSVVAIEWQGSGVKEVTLDLSVDSGISWRTVRWLSQGDSGRFQWTVPAVPTTRALVRVTGISDARLVDRSDATFTIAVDKDVATTEFITPHFNDTMQGSFVPRVEVRNNGALAVASLPVRLSLTWRPGDLLMYDTTVRVPNLAPGEVRTVDFPATRLLPEGNVVMVARTLLEGDRNPANDSLSRTADLAGGISPPSSIVADGLDAAATLRWAPSTTDGIAGYRIYRGSSPEDMIQIATVRPTVHAIVDDPLVNDRLYYYAVTAFKDTRESIYSAIAIADPTHQIAGSVLQRPRLLSPDNGASGIPLPTEVVWRTVPGAELYQVQIAADAGCTDVLTNELVREPHLLTLDVVDYARTYYWRVRTFNNSGVGQWSDVWSFSTGQSCANSALVFKGKAESAVLDTGFVWAGGPVTVEFWTYMKSTDLGSSSIFGVGYSDNTSNRFQAHAPWSDGTLYWDYGNTREKGRITADFKPYLDRWTHVALVSNGSNFKAIYLNGALAASGTSADNPGKLDSLRIGSAARGVYPSKATLDEFRIWSRARTQSEIQHDMNRALDFAPGLVARYHFDEGSGAVAEGLSSPPAQVLSATEWTESGAYISCVSTPDLPAPVLRLPTAGADIPPGAATLFTWSSVEGAGAYWIEIAETASFSAPVVSVDNLPSPWHTYGALQGDRTYYWRVRAIGPNGPGEWSAAASFTTSTSCGGRSLVLDGTGNIAEIPTFEWGSRAATVELWLFVDSADVRNSWLFYTAPGDSATRFSSHAPWSDRKLVFDFGVYGNKGRIQVDYAPYVGKWTHVAMVSNGKDFKAVYLDGQLAGSAASASRLRNPRRGLVIGGVRNGSRFFKSRLTEFRVWNVPRTAAAIREDMYRRLDGPRSGLVGYWPFDGTIVDSTVRDLSGFGNDAIMRNGPIWDSATPFPGPLPVAITGPAEVLHDTAGVVYSAPAGAGEYQWVVIGGTIVSGQSTASITVDWGGGPEGLVALVAAPTGCDLTTVLPVAISDGTVGVETGAGVSARLAVHPNPTNGQIEVPVTLVRPIHASLTIHDIRGVQVAVVAEGTVQSGTTTFRYDGSALPPGLYVVKLTTADGYFTRMVTIVR